MFKNKANKFFCLKTMYRFVQNKTSQKTVSMFGKKIKEQRERKGLSQRELGSYIELDAAYISKVESGEKMISRKHLHTVSQVLDIEEEELQKLWLADKVYKIVEEEDWGYDALKLAEDKVEYLKLKPK